MFDLHGHTALVTGSNRGIGKAIVLALAEQGANVYIHCRKPVETAQATLREAQTYGVQAACVYGELSEVTAAGDIANQMQQNALGMPDILVLNASYQIRRPWDKISAEDFQCQMQIDFFSSLQLIQCCAPVMLEKRWGRIITIGSTQQAKPHPEMIVYAGAKLAQQSMVENLSLQFAPYGVTVNNVAPGTIYTDRNTEALSDAAYHEKVRRDIPTGYIGQPQDCVAPVVMLCSEEGRYISGTNLYVDGAKHI